MKQLDFGSYSLAYHEQGVGEDVVFLVHGFPLDHSMWRYQFDELSRSHRVIAVDLRGFGASTGYDDTLSMVDYADDCARVLERLEIQRPVTFCGLSMGGYVAWQFWRRHASRLGRLILCDTRAQADSEEVSRGRRRMAFEVLSRGSGFVADAMLPRLMAPETYERYPERVERLRAVMESTDSRAIAAAQRAMAGRVDASGWLGQIAVPTLVICGVDDEISRTTEMRQFAQQMPQASYVEIPAAGHMAPMENEQAVNQALLEFLGGG